jgi:tetratricopeptide (TPR) repeat protein
MLRGQVAEARRLFTQTRAAATARGFPQAASGYAAQAALAELLYGYRGAALDEARRVLRNATANEPRLRAATALALAGHPEATASLVRQLAAVRPEDTLLHNVHLPIVEAAVLLARGRPDAAIEPLRRAAPYEHGTIAALVPAYLRAEAHLRAGAADEALREFRAVLADRGADPFSPLVALAHLGIARAHARAGAVAESRKAYEALLSLWAGADADMPVLKQARDELSKLR